MGWIASVGWKMVFSGLVFFQIKQLSQVILLLSSYQSWCKAAAELCVWGESSGRTVPSSNYFHLDPIICNIELHSWVLQLWHSRAGRTVLSCAVLQGPALRTRIAPPNLVLSTNLLNMTSSLLTKSFMKILKRTGLKMKLWGTPLVTGHQLDVTSFTLTLWV